MTISCEEVSDFLESHTEWTESYFLQRATLCWVNKWLLNHGYRAVFSSSLSSKKQMSTTVPRHAWDGDIPWRRIQQNSTVGDDTATYRQSGRQRINSEPPDRCMADLRSFKCKTISTLTQESFSIPESNRHGSLHRRNDSKRHLRSDFARSKSKSIFRTHEPSIDSEHANMLAERRSSLKSMRQCTSLPTTSGTMLSMLIQSNVSLPRYESKDEFYKRDLREASEKDFFLEIVKDISHDLEINSLTKMILLNISILLDAESTSLFFVEGPRDKRYLVCKESNKLGGCDTKNTKSIPLGDGILGAVALCGDVVNLANPCQLEKHRSALQETCVPDNVKSLLCMPIYNAEHVVIAVVQTVNKRGAETFSKDDEKLLEMYLAFCGLAISNAKAIEAYTKEYDRNKALLEVVHDLFEEQTSVEKLVTKLMRRAQALLKSERCVVMLHEATQDTTPNSKEFARVFDVQTYQKNGHENSIRSYSWSEFNRFNSDNGVITRGLTNCEKDPQVSKERSNILCQPIRDNECKKLGVAQLINKENGDFFDEHDNQFFEAFCIFCGLGIKNCQLYDEVSHSAARQAVALEVISYHATVPLQDVYRIKESRVPECNSWHLTSVDFNDFSLDSDDMVLAAIRIFIDSGLVATFSIQYETLVRWLLTVRKNYRTVAYHNWRHAFNVCQVMFVWLYSCNMRRHLSDVECLALLAACLCHDLDHRGTNNAFQHKCSTPLAQLYGSQATLEQHHFNHAVIILNSEGHNIFSNLTGEQYVQVMKVFKHAILSTDISRHMQVRDKFISLVESNLYNWTEREQRDLLISVLMTSCDVATITKPWHIQRKAADLVVTEFFDQGDKEKTLLKLKPAALMDREKQDELPRLQIQWIDGICLPLYKSLGALDSVFEPMLARVKDNRDHWEVQDRLRLEALTAESTQHMYILETDV